MVTSAECVQSTFHALAQSGATANGLPSSCDNGCLLCVAYAQLTIRGITQAGRKWRAQTHLQGRNVGMVAGTTQAEVSQP